MIRILFVDDEASVLHGLKRMLRSMRKEWEMTFLDSGAEAIAVIDSGTFDIVVSDLVMPGIDGVGVLEYVREHSPETVRIALSGYADRTKTMRAVAQVHQFLSKPCDSEDLKRILNRAIELSSFLQNARLRALLTKLQTLPSVAHVFSKVVKALQAPDAAAGDVGALIAQDAGLSTKVLQLANSAVFGLPQVVSSPVQATVMLGLETMRLLVLSIRLFEEFEEEEDAPVSPDCLWRHSVEVARLSKRLALAETADPYQAECAFLAGLLHDIGKLVLWSNLPHQYRAAINLSQKHPSRRPLIERQTLGASHGEIGAYLLALWGFSDAIIEAIALHHTPSESSASHFTPLTAVHAANFIVHGGKGEEVILDAAPLDHAYIERLGLEDRVMLWREMAAEGSDKTE